MANRDPKPAGTPIRAVRADIDAGALARVYLFHGEEAFLMRRFADALARKSLAPGAEALDKVVVDGEGRPASVDLRRLAAELATPPFLSPRKFVLVRNSGLFAFAKRAGSRDDSEEASDDDEGEEGAAAPADAAPKDRAEALARLVDAVPDSACLVFLEKRIDRRVKKPIEAVERNGKVVEFALQETDDLRVFIGREFAAAGLAIDADAVDSILVRTEGSMQSIASECEKLRLRCQGDGLPRVTLALVEDVCLPDLAGRVFDLTDAIGNGRPADALRILDTLLARKEPAQLLLYMLARHVRLLILAKETTDRSKLAVVLRLPPGIAARYADQARGFAIEALEALHAQCFEADAAMKSGRLAERAALEALLAGAPARGGPPRR